MRKRHTFILLLFGFTFIACGKTPEKGSAGGPKNAIVTLVELGSERCIPCRKMTAVLDAVRKRYPNTVRVVFHDVWKDRAPAEKYRIRVIPTQIFLDKNGKEYFRHEGYFPLEEVEKIIKQKLG